MITKEILTSKLDDLHDEGFIEDVNEIYINETVATIILECPTVGVVQFEKSMNEKELVEELYMLYEPFPTDMKE